MDYKSKLNQVRVLLGLAVLLEDLKSNDGKILSAEAFEVGKALQVDGAQATAGDYTLEDGRTLVVDANGIIVEITSEPAINEVEMQLREATTILFEENEALKVQLSELNEKLALAKEIVTNPEVKPNTNDEFEKFKNRLNK